MGVYQEGQGGRARGGDDEEEEKRVQFMEEDEGLKKVVHKTM